MSEDQHDWRPISEFPKGDPGLHLLRAGENVELGYWGEPPMGDPYPSDVRGPMWRSYLELRRNEPLRWQPDSFAAIDEMTTEAFAY